MNNFLTGVPSKIAINGRECVLKKAKEQLKRQIFLICYSRAEVAQKWKEGKGRNSWTGLGGGGGGGGGGKSGGEEMGEGDEGPDRGGKGRAVRGFPSPNVEC